MILQIPDQLFSRAVGSFAKQHSHLRVDNVAKVNRDSAKVEVGHRVGLVDEFRDLWRTKIYIQRQVLGRLGSTSSL